MATIRYSKYKILVDPESKSVQGLQPGDVVRRQYFDKPNLIYSLLIVLETGVDIIGGKESAYFIGALIEGDEPKTGEMLDFVRVTHLFNPDRGGALYLTASDSNAPYMDVIDGMGIETALCYPSSIDTSVVGKHVYGICGGKYVDYNYSSFVDDVSRVCRIEWSGISIGSNRTGFEQVITNVPPHPAQLVCSFKIRGSKNFGKVPVSFGYADNRETDGKGEIEITDYWQYHVFIVSIDYPVQYTRRFFIDMTPAFSKAGEWCELGELNIIPLSAITTLANGTKVRVGKVSGIIDPIFGTLEGYGAYFQHLYATKNVNIAGTLTAGDENGFSSTFYVGKIHKNVIRNSMDCEWIESSTFGEWDQPNPMGIGKTYLITHIAGIIVQDALWAKKHAGEKYCFSFWCISDRTSEIAVVCNDLSPQLLTIEGNSEWRRYSCSFVIKEDEYPLVFTFVTDTLIGFCSPQLEAGDHPTQYQPTDGTLSETDDYGAWFSKGGIGGTIQNPLLRLNEDGSLCSRDGSFVINPDGTGHFASGRFTWEKDTITLKDFTIRWEDIDEKDREEIYPITLEIFSKSGLTIKNQENDVDATALLYRNGKEIDPDGKMYLYSWQVCDKNMNVLYSYSGKSVVIPNQEILPETSVYCEVYKA